MTDAEVISLPKGWTCASFAEISENIPLTGKKLKQSEYKEKGILPVIDQGQNFIGGYTDHEEYKISTDSPIIVFGDHTKVIKYVDFSFVAGADGVKVIKPAKVFFPKLLYYFMQALRLPEKGYARHYQYLEKSIVPIPPLQEQYRIADKVEVLFSYLDAGVAQLRAVQLQLKRYRQAVLKAAFEGKLTQQWRQTHKNQIEPAQKLLERIIKVKESTKKARTDKQIYNNSEEMPELPESWVWTKLGKIISVHSGEGLTTRQMQNEGEYPVYGGNGVSGHYSKYLFEDSKVIIGRVGAKCGVIHITAPKSWVTENALVVDSWYMNIKFLYYSLSNLNLNQFSVSTAQPVISSTKIYPLNFKLPPLMEQEQIVREIEYRLSIADETNKSIINILKQADKLRQSVLKSAFEGKLVPQDPSDEPAERLLERIRAERLTNKLKNSQVELCKYVK
ncbi:MAG: restriction endonuclease subunit S [Candidatus Bathyarchaeota archaeon]|nr:restriction endonuclease subunit S [Candidatus Bathyarchaeota archaeon]